MINKNNFSIIHFDMYTDNDKENHLFELTEFESITMECSVIPLFNMNFHANHDVFDQAVFADVVFISGLFIRQNNKEQLMSAYVSFSSDYNQDFNSYNFSLQIMKEDIKLNIYRGNSYKFKIAYLIVEDGNLDNIDGSKAIEALKNNVIFETTIPLSMNGEWLND